jgi:hypothetical protein|tara:strand:- start:18 stop:212 length:195 start_codon:yes stop_codon:yes gene_type:complete
MLVDENKILKKNVAEIQQQLANANIRISELVTELSRKQEALLDIGKIFSKTTQKNVLLDRKETK